MTILTMLTLSAVATTFAAHIAALRTQRQKSKPTIDTMPVRVNLPRMR